MSPAQYSLTVQKPFLKYHSFMHLISQGCSRSNIALKYKIIAWSTPLKFSTANEWSKLWSQQQYTPECTHGTKQGHIKARLLQIHNSFLVICITGPVSDHRLGEVESRGVQRSTAVPRVLQEAEPIRWGARGIPRRTQDRALSYWPSPWHHQRFIPHLSSKTAAVVFLLFERVWKRCMMIIIIIMMMIIIIMVVQDWYVKCWLNYIVYDMVLNLFYPKEKRIRCGLLLLWW